MNVEARLKEIVGEPAGRLHTARSRNDQVATDFRLWVREQTDAAIAGLESLQRALLAQAKAGADWIMPGFTHLQTAQPRDMGPPHDGLCGDVRPRRGAFPRRTGADERMPARGGGAGGHVLSPSTGR